MKSKYNQRRPTIKKKKRRQNDESRDANPKIVHCKIPSAAVSNDFIDLGLTNKNMFYEN